MTQQQGLFEDNIIKIMCVALKRHELQMCIFVITHIHAQVCVLPWRGRSGRYWGYEALLVGTSWRERTAQT